jgi:hypothetical protein
VNSDTRFVLVIMAGFAWGWMTKALKDWGAEMDRQLAQRRERRRHPSWGGYE